jgi:hypothetical protein
MRFDDDLANFEIFVVRQDGYRYSKHADDDGMSLVTRCANCFKLGSEHQDGKCLFAPTNYLRMDMRQAMTYELKEYNRTFGAAAIHISNSPLKFNPPMKKDNTPFKAVHLTLCANCYHWLEHHLDVYCLFGSTCFKATTYQQFVEWSNGYSKEFGSNVTRS